jgi:hypothetical protein
MSENHITIESAVMRIWREAAQEFQLEGSLECARTFLSGMIAAGKALEHIEDFVEDPGSELNGRDPEKLRQIFYRDLYGSLEDVECQITRKRRLGNGPKALLPFVLAAGLSVCSFLPAFPDPSDDPPDDECALEAELPEHQLAHYAS